MSLDHIKLLVLYINAIIYSEDDVKLKNLHDILYYLEWREH